MQNAWLRGALSAVLISGLLATAVGATLEQPQQEPPTRPQGPPPGRGPGANPETRAEELAKSLKLSGKQKNEVTTILKNQHQQMEALRNSQGGDADREKGMSQMRRLDSETDAKLKAVLSAAQYNQYLAQKPGPRDGKGGKGGKPPKGERPAKAPEQAE
ncbi:hypothetical protein EJV47_01175 [Hymenobacter gummosus]|uniref:DUF4890 domain-containing protein n=1 Tax=Hymenobacter gummosus TaxID=1776032 RepID=A0A3S0K8L1_9BACT|nr:hypothetical protein [Hymenobacter gummosus]RTQ53383.1 hypothetical protein EJV47_01175 [Hymenobacter gummosus]